MRTVTHDESECREGIERARAGERAAFDDAVARVRGRLARLIRFQLGPALRRELDPEDVLQETSLRAFAGLGRFRSASQEAFFRWLGGIARNVIRERARKIAPVAEVDADPERQPAPSDSPSRAMRRKERFERLQRALDGLPSDYRRVLRSVLVEKLPIGEIARRLGKTPNAVSLLLLRANRKLRERLSDTRSLGLPAAELDWGESDDRA